MDTIKRQDMPNVDNYRINTAQDIHQKLQHFTLEDKKEIINTINEFMKKNRVKTPVIRIHNSEITSLVYSNQLSNTLAMHLTDVFIVDFPHEETAYNLKNIVRIAMPRLRDNGLLILKHEQGIRILKKNVSYGLRPQFIGFSNN